MSEWVDTVFREDFGTNASIFVMILVATGLIVAGCKRRAVKIEDIVLLVFGSAGSISGLKILVLTLTLKPAQLGPLGDDKPTLLLGGIAAIAVAAREAFLNWRKVSGI
jgi:hypothetical protein